MKYATNTEVPVDRSKAEIERVLTKYGANKFGYMMHGDRAQIGFMARGINIRMEVALPAPNDFARTPTGRTRTATDQVRECQKATRQRWRALLLIVRAKLEACESGITTFESEWLPYTVLHNGKTVAEHVMPQIERGKLPQLMLGSET